MRQRVAACLLSAALGMVPAVGGEKPGTKRMTCHWSSGPLFYSGLPQPNPLFTVEIEIDSQLQKVTELYKNADGSNLFDSPAGTSLFRSPGELTLPFVDATSFGEEYRDGRTAESFTESVAMSENLYTWSRRGTFGAGLVYRRYFTLDTLSGEYKERFQRDDSGAVQSQGEAIYKCTSEP